MLLKADNAIITLTDTEDLGRGRHFESRFLQPGLAGYPDQFGNVLITKENLDKFVYTLRNKPVIINHKDIITEADEVGEVFNVWYNQQDGWYWCDGVITDKAAQNLVKNKGWSVSCSYNVLKADNAGGTENNIPYDMEFLDGVFTHLALVSNPRYERANIVLNSKTVIKNYRQDQKRDENGRWTDEDVLTHIRDKEQSEKNIVEKENKRVEKTQEQKPDDFYYTDMSGMKYSLDEQKLDLTKKSFYNPKTKIIELKGNEIGNTETEIRENAINYYKTHFQGHRFQNKDLGKILFSNVGLKKLKANSADIEKLKAIPALKDIIEYGNSKGPEDPEHPRKDGIIKFYRINNDVKVGDAPTQNMSVLVGEDKNGNRFYNLNHKTYTIENSSEGKHAKGVANEEFSINIITNSDPDFNPNVKEYEEMQINNKDLRTAFIDAIAEVFAEAIK